MFLLFSSSKNLPNQLYLYTRFHNGSSHGHEAQPWAGRGPEARLLPWVLSLPVQQLQQGAKGRDLLRFAVIPPCGQAQVERHRPDTALLLGLGGRACPVGVQLPDRDEWGLQGWGQWP